MKILSELISLAILIYFGVALISGINIGLIAKVNNEAIDAQTLTNHTILWYKYGFINDTNN